MTAPRVKVAISGMGILSSLGNSADEMFDSLVENKSAIRHYPDWAKYKGLHTQLGAPVYPYDEKTIPRAARRSMSRMSEMAVLATKQALDQSRLPLAGTNQRSCLIMGSTSGSPDTMETYFRKLFEKGGPEGQLSTSFFKVMNHSVAANVAVGLEISIPLLSPSSACSTSSQAIALGWELIQSGLYDVVIAGGADELHYTSAAVFDIVMAASRGYNDRPSETPRPFDSKRDGLVVSEGASVIVLESEEHLKKREGRALAYLSSGAYLCDGKHMSQPQAESMKTTMEIALTRAGLTPQDIGYVNAHATGTQVGDIEEAKATHQLFGNSVPVSSLKGHFGHSLAACGAIEVIACIQMMKRSLLIPTRNLETIDPLCAGPLFIKENLEKRVIHSLSNNFAFGGMNTSLLVSVPG